MSCGCIKKSATTTLSCSGEPLLLRSSEHDASRRNCDRLRSEWRKSGRDVEFGTIYSKLFTETGELKYFVSVAGLAKRTGVSPNAVRRRIAKGEIEAVKGYGGYYIDTCKVARMLKRAA